MITPGSKVFFAPLGLIGLGIAKVSVVKFLARERRHVPSSVPFIPSHVEIAGMGAMLWGAQGTEGFIPKPSKKRLAGLVAGRDFVVVEPPIRRGASALQAQLESMHGDGYENWGRVVLAGVDGNTSTTPERKDCVEAALITDVAMGIEPGASVIPRARENMTPLAYLVLLLEGGWYIKKKLPPMA